ncbi:MAG: MFS transporter [Bifidobacteriaceae bacterium]|nr:MFS transporter [Bifidobacteriaceae bacterium]
MSKRNVLIVTFALLLSNAMAGLDSTIVNTALPAIIADLHGLELMGWIVAVFLLATAVSTPLWSKMGERIGNRRTYQIAAVLFVLGSLLQGLAPNMVSLIVSRAVAGIGNGGMISLPYIIYAQLYEDPRKRMKVLGFVTASYSAATIIGPLVGGAIVDAWSWHWVFYINVPIGLVSAVLVQVFFKEQRVKRAVTRIDYLGASLLTVGLIALLGGIELIGEQSALLVGGLMAVAVVCLVAMLPVEARAADPIIPGRLFRNRDLMVDFVLFALIWGSFIGFIVYAPMWAQALLGTSALVGGATQIPGSFTNFGGAGSVASLRKRFSPQQVLLFSIMALVVTFAIMVLAGPHTPYWVLLLAAVFEGFGNGVCFSELQVKVQQDASRLDVPVATSSSFLVRMLSQTLTAAVFGLVLNSALHRGIAQSAADGGANGTITMKMMNKLSDAASNASLPQALLPRMRSIMYSGLHNIMLLCLVLMLAALAVNLHELWREQRALRHGRSETAES